MRFNRPKDFNAIFKIGTYHDVDSNLYIVVGDDYKFNLPIINFNRRIAELFIEKNKSLFKKDITSQLTEVNFAVENGIIKVKYYTIYNIENNYKYGKSYQAECPFITEFNMEEILNHTSFILGEYNTYSQNKYVIILKKYELQQTETDVFTIMETGKLEISLVNGELAVDIDGEKSEEEFFSNLADIFQMNISFLQLIFDKYKIYPGMKDIYYRFRTILENSYKNLELDDYKSYLFYKNLFDEKFYYLMERRVKEDYKYDEIYDMNPVFTGKPFPGLKETLPKKIKEFAIVHDFDELNILEELVDNKNVGSTGVIIFIEFYNEFMTIERKYNRWEEDAERYFEQLNNLYKVFTIKPRALIDRMIRAAFNSNKLELYSYLSTVNDYARMCQQLDIPVLEIPKDYIECHNQLQSQIKEIRDIKLNDDFKTMILKNNELLRDQPESDKYIIVSPEDANDLIQEGQALNHCVGSYVSSYANGSSKIFFLRRRDNPRSPFITMELNRNNDLVQIKGYSNNAPDRECHEYAASWVEKLGGTVYE